ncbi:hypothetical protein Zm00014a_008716 [Zea mays]|uniref:Uncharacterized protein n=1 Tax=Zea mays TaxID=4577 RepID=A0A3L6FIX3_MAIZE|nr:hypothetical protein Zm00014a_008716 [Zea mays]
MEAALNLLTQIHLLVLLLGCSLLLPRPTTSATAGNHTAPMALSSCLPDQASSLLRLKRSFVTTNYSAVAFRSWRAGTDCCRWAGVRCSSNSDGGGGRVTSLDLSDQGLESGGLDPAIFHLSSLERLNLAYNDFNGSQLPSSGFERLANLTHLNLSTSSFSGQVPASGIGGLTSLVSLDLSTSYEFYDLLDDGFLLHRDSNSDARLTVQSFETLVANLRNLRELHLGLVDLSSDDDGAGPRWRWCSVVAASCPELRVLSLPRCGLSGPICGSLSSLRSISVVNLEYNRLSGPFPDFFTNSSDLTVLRLRRTDIQGRVSPAIFLHRKLVTVDLYNNYGISGYLPDFPAGSRSSRLENLNVGRTSFYGTIPNSLGNLTSLKELGFGATGFSGDIHIPSSIGDLKSLNALEISGMGIVGPMPSWIANLTSLTALQLYDCGLSGPIPRFVAELRLLKRLALCGCSFSGEIPSHVITNLTQLQILLLYSNSLEGTVELDSFGKNMPYLIALDLSDNNLLVLDGGENNSSASVSLPKLKTLVLGGCGMSKFPDFLRRQDEIDWLDLSYNQIRGAVPGWAWELWNGMVYLVLSNNEFTSVGHGHLLPLQDMIVLDLSNNLFDGTIPIPQGSADALDYSNNMFSSVPAHLSSHLDDVALFLAPGNRLSGNLSASFCGGGTSILLLDLSYNNFSGSIPSCLMENVNGMQSLNLRKNRLHGEIPDSSKKGCSFEALDFSGNQIEGRLPRSMASCESLEVLDVGNNQISDAFPCWMSELPRLQVLVLKSNRFFGQVSEPVLQEKKQSYSCAFPSASIVDLSSNSFSGPLPEGRWFKNLRSMVLTDPSKPLVMDHEVPGVTRTYRYTTAVTYKGHDTSFTEILTALVFIDFSNNTFSGSIPAAIGELDPTSALSFNGLSGEIPKELASLDSLTTLNLSDNRLVGSIPASPHFSTFSSSSFQGNDGLCGPPLSKACNDNVTQADAVRSEKRSVDFVLFLFVGVGFGVGFAVAVVVAWGIPVRKPW